MDARGRTEEVEDKYGRECRSSLGAVVILFILATADELGFLIVAHFHTNNSMNQKPAYIQTRTYDSLSSYSGT